MGFDRKAGICYDLGRCRFFFKIRVEPCDNGLLFLCLAACWQTQEQESFLAEKKG
jgi:hypothetical protein